MHAVKTIVLDEGDTLIVPEHFDTVAGIIKSTMKERQVVLFSATVTPNIMEALAELMDNPVDISIKRDDNFMGNVDHLYFGQNISNRNQLFGHLLQQKGLQT